MNQKHPITGDVPPEDIADTAFQETDDVEDLSQGDELYERHEIVADPKQSLIRLDKFLIDRLAHRSRSKVQTAIKAGSVKVNEMDVKPNYKVKPGNIISIILPRSLEETYQI